MDVNVVALASQYSPPIVGSLFSAYSRLTKRTTRLDLPTADSPVMFDDKVTLSVPSLERPLISFT